MILEQYTSLRKEASLIETIKLTGYAGVHTDNHRLGARPFLYHELRIYQFLFHHQLSFKKENKEYM